MVLLDQRRLPGAEVELVCRSSAEVAEAIRTLAVRGAVAIGVAAAYGYALAAARHMHEFRTTSEQLAEVAVATRKWAALNPRALMRDPLTVEAVLSSRLISWPLHLLDCCLVTDAGGAVVVTSAERARDLRRKPVYVLGTGEAYGASTGLAIFHAMTGNPEQAAEWAARGIAQRFLPLFYVVAPLLRSQRQWPALARMMNLSA